MELFVCFLFILPAGWFFLGIVLPLTRRAAEDACPGCTHPTQGLVRPICPECGQDFTPGIQVAGQMTRFWSNWLGVNLTLGGICLCILGLSCSLGIWILHSAMEQGPGYVSSDGLLSVLILCIPLFLSLGGGVGLLIWGTRVLKADRLKPFLPLGITKNESVPPTSFEPDDHA